MMSLMRRVENQGPMIFKLSASLEKWSCASEYGSRLGGKKGVNTAASLLPPPLAPWRSAVPSPAQVREIGTVSLSERREWAVGSVNPLTLHNILRTFGNCFELILLSLPTPVVNGLTFKLQCNYSWKTRHQWWIYSRWLDNLAGNQFCPRV